jgi:hypothetical protein
MSLCPSSYTRREPYIPPPPKELAMNCITLASTKNGNADIVYAFAGIGIFFISIFALMFLVQATDPDSKNATRPIMVLLSLACFAGIGGLGYAIHYNKIKVKKALHAKWPIEGYEQYTCVTLMTSPLGNKIDFTSVESDGITPIPLPADAVISQLTIVGAPGTLQLFATRTMPDGAVKKIELNAGFEQIATGFQSRYDAIYSTNLYSLEVVVTKPCIVKFKQTPLTDTDMLKYIRKYRIVARQCPNFTVTIDDAHTVDKKVEVACA